MNLHPCDPQHLEHLEQDLEHFHHPEKFPCRFPHQPPSQSTFPPPTGWPSDFWPRVVHLPSEGRKGEHTVPRLLSLTQLSGFSPGGARGAVPGGEQRRHVTTPCFSPHSCARTLGPGPVLRYCESSCYEHSCARLLWACVFISLRKIPRGGMAGSSGRCMFNFFI